MAKKQRSKLMRRKTVARITMPREYKAKFVCPMCGRKCKKLFGPGNGRCSTCQQKSGGDVAYEKKREVYTYPKGPAA